MAPERELHQMTFEKGIILGYANREHEVPEGYVLRADNFIIQEDGSLAPRPGLMVTPANGSGANPTDVRWDQALTNKHRTLCRQDNTNYVAGRTSPTHVAIPFAGTSVPPGSTAFWAQYAIVGEAATYGNTTVFPIARPTINGAEDPPGGPAPGRLAVVAVCYFNNSGVVPTSVGYGNLYDINGHFIVQEAVQQQVTTQDAVFARMLCISWKSRIFVIAGTRVTYSAAGNPTSYSVANGGGFFNLDTDSQIVGAFVLDDNLYIATRKELFVFNYSNNPAVDGELRSIAKIQALGAAEYDNVGYIAVREGLYRIISGQIEPTFIPSAESHMSFQTYDRAETGITPERIEIPIHCVISKLGDQIILSGIGTNLISTQDDSTPFCPVFSTVMEAWTAWQSTGSNSRRWFNLLTPLIRVDVQNEWGSEQYVGTNITQRRSNLASRMRSFVVVNRESFNSAAVEVDNQIKRWGDTFVPAGATSFSQFTTIRPQLVTPYYSFEDALGFKRLHRMWMTGKFKPQNFIAGDPSSDLDDQTQLNLVFVTGPNENIQIVNYEDVNSLLRKTPDLFDISPYEIKFFGALRFLYARARVIFNFTDVESITDVGFSFPNIAISSIYFDITRYDRKSNRTF